MLHIAELFLAESKTQVYGQLHDLIWRYPTAADQLHATTINTNTSDIQLRLFYLCYDDGCHLK